MRRLLPVLLLTASCSSYETPTAETFRRLNLSPAPPPAATRIRVHLSLDSRWLAGEFDGVVVALPGRSPVARLQLFGDVGPKMIDLLARPDRVAGYFPQTREGLDVRLPEQATPHPLLFLGVTLLEDLADVDESRVLGVRESDPGWWLDLKPLVPGLRSEALRGPDGRLLERRFTWMYGVSWRAVWESRDECRVSASGVDLRLRILDREPVDPLPARAFELAIPDDVRVVGRPPP